MSILLGDEVQSTAIKIPYKGAEITAKIIGELIKAYLQRSNETFGKQSIKELNRKGNALDSIPVMNEDLKGLQKEFKKFGVDYTVMKSMTEKDTYDVYFKGADITQIQTALKNYAAKSLHQQRKGPTMKERMAAAEQKAKERNESRKQQHEKKFERGRDER